MKPFSRLSAASDLTLGLIGAVLAVAAWEISARTGLIDPAIFPSPSLAIRAAAERLTAETVADNLFWSLLRVFSGFLLGALIMEARTFYRSEITIIGMLVIGLIGFTISAGLMALERAMLPWAGNLDRVRR